MIDQDDGYLARSKPQQSYEAHIKGTYDIARATVKRMARYISGDEVRDFFVGTVLQAAAWHDLGKLADENQAHLKCNAKGNLPIDHQGAGAAHANRMMDSFAVSMLIKAHHSGHQSYYRERSRLYEGAPHSHAYRSYDPKTLEDTDKHIDDYIARHEKAVQGLNLDEVDIPPLQDRDVDALLYRIMLSVLVDADHRDAAGQGNEFPSRPACRWEERLSVLQGNWGGSMHTDVSVIPLALQQKLYAACCNADVMPMAFLDAPIGMNEMTAPMVYALRAAAEHQLQHVFVVIPHGGHIDRTTDILRKLVKLDDEDTSEIVVAYHARGNIGRDAGLGTLWRAPIIVIAEQDFWKAISAIEATTLRKLRELTGSAILYYDCFAGLEPWKWPQAYKWLKMLCQDCGCRVLLHASPMIQYWELPRHLRFPEKIPSILSAELQQLLDENARQRICFCFDDGGRRPVLIHTWEQLAAQIQQEPGRRLVVLDMEEDAVRLKAALQSKGERVCLASSPETLTHAVEQGINENMAQHITIISVGVVPERNELSFAVGFVQLHSMSLLLRAANLVHSEDHAARIFTFELRTPDTIIQEGTIRSSIALREMIREGAFDMYGASQLLTESIQREYPSQNDSRAQELQHAEENLNFKKVSTLFSQ